MSGGSPLQAVLLALLTLSANADVDPFYHSTRYDSGRAGHWPSQEFTSDHAVTAPIVNFVRYGEQCQDGLYTFISPYGGSVPTPGPMILDQDGHLVWTKSFGSTYNMNMQNYKGEDFITFWVGNDDVSGHGEGIYYMLDSNYQTRYELRGGDGLSGDMHEFRITCDDTAVYTIYEKIPADLRAVGGSEIGWIWDSIFREVNIETGDLIFQWRASEHSDFSEAIRKRETHGDTEDDPWDFFHINSIDKDTNGNFLISSSYYNSLYYIDGRTSDVIWKLGGADNKFRDLSDGAATNISSQHHARWVQYGASISLFDNAAHASRGLWVDIDQSKMTAKVHHQYQHPSFISSQSQGSMQILGNDKVLVGYGENAGWTEFTTDGKPVCEVHFGPQKEFGKGQVSSYRAFKHPWVGRPLTRPSWTIYGMGTNIGYASWNGATEVKMWLLEGSESGQVDEDPEALEPLQDADVHTVIVVPKSGFETVIAIPQDCLFPNLRVVAIDEEGNRIGTSYFVMAQDRILRTSSIVGPDTTALEDDGKHEENITPESVGEEYTQFEQNGGGEVQEYSPTVGVSTITILLSVCSALCGLFFLVWAFRSSRRFRRRRSWLGRGDNSQEGKFSGSGRSSADDGDLSGEDERLIRAHEFVIPFDDAEADREASRGR